MLFLLATFGFVSHVAFLALAVLTALAVLGIVLALRYARTNAQPVGFFGPIAGIALAAVYLWAVVHYTVQDAPIRWAGLLVGVALFITCCVVAIRAEANRRAQK